MNKKYKIVIAGIVLFGVIGVLWILKTNKNNSIAVNRQAKQEVGEEIEFVKTNKNNIQDISNINFEFGINDSQLKYNVDGGINKADWEKFEHLDHIYSLPLNWSVITTNSVNGSMDITNLSNYDKYQDYFLEVRKLEDYVEIGTGGAPADIDYEKNDKTMEELLMEVAESEVKHSIFSACVEGSKSIPGRACEMTQPECSYSNVKEKFGKKYIVVDCYYDKSESRNEKYILSKTIVYPGTYKDHITKYNVSLETNKKDLIDSNKKIFLDIFDDALKAELKD